MAKISEIYIYPIKSLSGISLQESRVEERGLQYDRRWVLVDENNQFITIRENPEMTLIDVSIEKNGLKLKHKTKNFEDFLVPFQPQTTDSQLVRVWGDEVLGVRVSDEADAWLQKVLNMNCRLFYQPDTSFRPVDAHYAIDNEHVSLADAYPILLAGQASIDDLNERLVENVSIRRFRPNLVFTGGKPFIEDSWRDMQIGSAELVGVKNCARCPIPTINPDTAEQTKEPIKTLASYRTRNNKVYFGQNLLVKLTGIIKIGDEIIL
jgi:uncharacterized protein